MTTIAPLLVPPCSSIGIESPADKKGELHSRRISLALWYCFHQPVVLHRPITMPDIVPERRLIKGEHVNPLVELLTTFWLTVSFGFFFYDWYARVRISQMVQAKKFARDSDRTRTWAQITRGWLLSISGKKRKIIFLGDKIGKGEGRGGARGRRPRNPAVWREKGRDIPRQNGQFYRGGFYNSIDGGWRASGSFRNYDGYARDRISRIFW